VTAVGIGKDEFWDSVVEGRSGISKVSSFDTKDFRCHYAGEIKNFDPCKLLSRRKANFLGRTSQLAVTAAHLAILDAKLPVKSISGAKTGVFIGTTMGERPLEDSIFTWITEGKHNIDKTKILQSSANVISASLGMYFKLNGPNYIFSNACAASNYALGYGFDLVRSGEINFALVGGADSFSKVAFSGFHRLYAMSPEKCRPFDKNRKGMMVGEGSGILILETLESALGRKASIYAEILGYGLSCDAYHITAPRTEGVEKAIRKALKEAGITPEDVDYINAHGTGTPANDRSECGAIKRVFKEHVRTLAVSSTKSMLGHTMGAASAIESAATCLALKNGVLPPTINFETPDPECAVDCVPNKARRQDIKIAMKNSFAFGGNNACVVFRKYE